MTEKEFKKIALTDVGGGYLAPVAWSAVYDKDGDTIDISELSNKDFNNITENAQNVIIQTLSLIYPVGSIYLTINTICPLANYFGTWELVASGRALWTGTGTNGGTTLSAGLPSISHTHTRGSMDITGDMRVIAESWHVNGKASGAFTKITGGMNSNDTPGSIDYGACGGVEFKASNAWTGSTSVNSSVSSIYGSSPTVQPPAYIVNAFRRTV